MCVSRLKITASLFSLIVNCASFSCTKWVKVMHWPCSRFNSTEIEMAGTSKNISSIGDIRTCLTAAIKNWHMLTSDLSWPEGDSSLADMDIHISTLRAVNAQLAKMETNLALKQQQSLVAHFDEESVQDPGKFASFAASLNLAAAA
jgi:hypothetical protein